MKKLSLFAIAFAIAFVAYVPVGYAASVKTNAHGNSPKTVQQSTVSEVKGKDSITRISYVKVAAAKAANQTRICSKDCVNGANKKIEKSVAAKCGKALGKKNKTNCQTCKTKTESVGTGIGHQTNTHTYNGKGIGHLRHHCATSTKRVKEGFGKFAETFVPKANAQSAEAGSYEPPAALPTAGAGVALQIIAFLSSLFGAWGLRKVI